MDTSQLITARLSGKLIDPLKTRGHCALPDNV
jgi:hypothetical protein